MFIVLEGIDGSGKSTLSLLLSEWFSKQGFDVVLTREPRDPYRSLIFDEKTSSKEEYLLFLADRVNHIESVIKPALKQGKVVISDRFELSTLAYQGDNYAVPSDIKTHLSSWVMGGLQYPDITFILDVDPVKSLARATDKNKFEAKGIDYYKNLANKYKLLAKNYPNTYIIDSNSSITNTLQELILICNFKIKYENQSI